MNTMQAFLSFGALVCINEELWASDKAGVSVVLNHNIINFKRKSIKSLKIRSCNIAIVFLNSNEVNV